MRHIFFLRCRMSKSNAWIFKNHWKTASKSLFTCELSIFFTNFYIASASCHQLKHWQHQPFWTQPETYLASNDISYPKKNFPGSTYPQPGRKAANRRQTCARVRCMADCIGNRRAGPGIRHATLQISAPCMSALSPFHLISNSSPDSQYCSWPDAGGLALISRSKLAVSPRVSGRLESGR